MYRSVSEKYKLIEKKQRLVLIPNENNAELCDMIRKNVRNRYIMRQAMRDSVSLYEYEFMELAKTGVLTNCGDIAILEDPGCYDENIGLIVKDTGDALFA